MSKYTYFLLCAKHQLVGTVPVLVPIHYPCAGILEYRVPVAVHRSKQFPILYK